MKKAVVFLLVIMLALGIFTGCSGSSKEDIETYNTALYLYYMQSLTSVIQLNEYNIKLIETNINLLKEGSSFEEQIANPDLATTVQETREGFLNVADSYKTVLDEFKDLKVPPECKEGSEIVEKCINEYIEAYTLLSEFNTDKVSEKVDTILKYNEDLSNYFDKIGFEPNT